MFALISLNKMFVALLNLQKSSSEGHVVTNPLSSVGWPSFLRRIQAPAAENQLAVRCLEHCCAVCSVVAIARRKTRKQWTYAIVGAEQRAVWSTLVAHVASAPIRIMFLGDSITDGGAADTHHMRKHPNGSCSYRFSFLSHITSVNSSSSQRDAQRRLHPRELTTVGPFSSNCGDTVVPDKCFQTLRQAWGNLGARITDSDPSSLQWRQHAATSGVMALGLIRQHQTWEKRSMCYEKAGLLRSAPPVPEPVAAMEQRYREVYPNRENVSDVAVWSAAYRPHLVIILLGTNDLRWERPWREVLFESLPAVVHELVLHASMRSPLDRKTSEANRTRPLGGLATSSGGGRVVMELNERRFSSLMCPTFVALSTLYPRLAFADDVRSFNDALLEIRRKRQVGRQTLCPTYETFFQEKTVDTITGETFLLCHPCLRIVDGGSMVDDVTGVHMKRDAFVSRFTFDGLHPNDEGDMLLGRRLAREVMDL
jgi:hypothetical protein